MGVGWGLQEVGAGCRVQWQEAGAGAGGGREEKEQGLSEDMQE